MNLKQVFASFTVALLFSGCLWCDTCKTKKTTPKVEKRIVEKDPVKGMHLIEDEDDTEVTNTTATKELS